MKIAVLSDIHGNLANLKKALSLIKEEKIKTIIVCGDFQDPEAVSLIGALKLQTLIVFGNADFDEFIFEKEAKKYPNIQIFEKIGEIVLKNKKIAFCHFYQTGKKLALTEKYDLIFCGHRHSPWEEKIGKTILIRPGNIAGLYYNPTFCIYDLEKMKAELVLLND